MRYERIVKCDVCGTEFLTHRVDKLRCSRRCANIAANRAARNRNKGNTECPYNKAVMCQNGNCDTCGWNPVVMKRRMEAMRNG